MTKEELKQKAEEYALEKCKECYMCNSEENGERGYCPKLESRKEGYIAGAEPREKRIAELEAQIEKMKQDLDSARENANRQEQWEIYSVLNGIYNDNFEVITGISN